MPNPIVTYEKTANASVDQKLQSLCDNLNRVLNNIEASGLKDGAVIDGERVKIIKVGGSGLGGVIDGKYVIVKNLDAQSITTGDLAAKLITANVIDAINAYLGEARINIAHVDNLSASEEWVQQLMVQGHLIAQSATGFELIGVHIDGDLVNANTIKANKLLLRNSEDGLYYELNFPTAYYECTEEDEYSAENVYFEVVDRKYVECDPQPTQAEYEANPGHYYLSRGYTDEQLENGLLGSNIVAHTITAEEITTNNLYGTGGWINLAKSEMELGNPAVDGYLSFQKNSLTGKYELIVHAGSITFDVSKSGTTGDDEIVQADIADMFNKTSEALSNEINELNQSVNGNIDIVVQTTGSLQVDNVEVDSDTYLLNATDHEEFIYETDHWIRSLTMERANLSTFGITLTAAPYNQDIIKIDVNRNGIINDIDDIRQIINNYNPQDIQDAIENKIVNGNLSSRFIRIEPEVPSISVVADDNAVIVKNNRIEMQTSNNTIPMYIEDDSMLVDNIQVVNYLPRVTDSNGLLRGQTAWIARSNGHFSLKRTKGGL